MYLTLREMWREAVKRRRLIAVVLVISAVAGLFVAFRPGLPPEGRQYTVWLASADILVDTADSQVVDSRGPDFLSLANRSTLLGNLIATQPLRTAIGERAGVNPGTLTVVPPVNTSTSTTGGVALTPTPVSTDDSSKIPDAEATVLTVSTDPNLPILRVAAQAPDAATASRLTAATSTELGRHLKTVGVSEAIPTARKLVLRPLAAPSPAPVARGTSRSTGLFVAVLLALFGCGAVVGLPMIARRWRSAAAAADREAEEASGEPAEAPGLGVASGPGRNSNGSNDYAGDESGEPAPEPEPEPEPEPVADLTTSAVAFQPRARPRARAGGDR